MKDHRISPLSERTALQEALDAALGKAYESMPSSAPQAEAPTRASVRAAASALVERNRTRQRSMAGQTGQPRHKEQAKQTGTKGAEDTEKAPRQRRRSPPPARPVVQQRATDFQSLGALAHELRVQQVLAQALEQRLREVAARRVAEQQLFARSVGPVTSLRDANLALLQPPAPEPLPLQLWLDEERALLESISDDFDVATLLDTDDQLSFRRPGIGVEITRRLRSGHWSIQRQLDLHGLRIDEAREALGVFIRQSHKGGLRCVRVVHGKGLGSPGKTPVLKGRVQRWLVQKNEVLAFVQARPAEGGAGALVVLLQPSGLRRV